MQSLVPQASAALAKLAASPLDEGVLRLWLANRSVNTKAAYERDVRAFFAWSGRSLAEVTLADLYGWWESQAGAALASRTRRLAAVKSLLTYAEKGGFLQLNPGVAFRVEKPTEALQERILPVAEVRRIIAGEPDDRRRALLRLLYTTGLRASEAADLRWRHMVPSTARGGPDKHGGCARVLGKGGKLREVAILAALWGELAALALARGPETPVIAARNGEALDRHAVHRIVKRAVRRARVDPAASAHWLRHAHASHALDEGCPVHVLQASLGHASLSTTSKYVHVRPGEGSSAWVKG